VSFTNPGPNGANEKVLLVRQSSTLNAQSQDGDALYAGPRPFAGFCPFCAGLDGDQEGEVGL
jgi:hypothetical protein